ncbi:MAG TPA: FlgD immunoglobulin-like domain containing protein [Candidatus Krumholzibacteria bacterium]|nr:FlgD immunoglobulin-like domain containing protein [Candidatus Krumholzibacteria bacterium]
MGPRPALLVILFLLAAAVASAERPPTPPELRNHAAAASVNDDLLRPARLGAAAPAAPRDGRDPLAGLDPRDRELALRALPLVIPPEIGGDDVVVTESPDVSAVEVGIAENGAVFVAVGYYAGDPTWSEWIDVFRSTDGGTTFQAWGQIGADDGSVHRLRDLDVAGGSVPRVFVTCMAYGGSGFAVEVAYADPAAAAAAWTTTVPLGSGASFLNPSLEIDDRSFESYYVYLVASGIDGNGDDIWFTRSTNQGQTWAAGYRIASLASSGNLMYSWPRISYGYGGVIHVLWTYTERLQDTFDDAVRSIRAINYASAPADWGPLYGVTSSLDGVEQIAIDICASLATSTAVLIYSQAFFNFADPAMRVSTDAGIDWFGTPEFDAPWSIGGDIEYSLTSGRFLAAGVYGDDDGASLVLSSADDAAPASWSALERFSDAPTSWRYWPQLALDRSRDEQPAATVRTTDSSAEFDALWRGAPGYPNLEPGLPVDLAMPAVTSPVLVDLDQDGDLEIVFGNAAGQVEARHHTGDAVAGWPVALPAGVASVAVGELSHGEPTVVAGGGDGDVHAFDPRGVPRDGWPVQYDPGAPAFVSIGALGGPYPRTVVVGTGGHIGFLNYRGVSPLETFGWNVFTGDVIAAPAIGDIDDDGVAEIVAAAGGSVFAFKLYEPSPVFSRALGSDVSAAVTLGDLDLDGTLEIAAPTAAGQLFVLDHTGADHPGFPFTSPTGTALTAAAWAQIRGTFEPELAVGARNWNVHLLYSSGAQAGGFPVVPGNGWYLFANPIMGAVEGGSGDVVAPSRSTEVYCWDNFGGLIPGWPRALRGGNQVEVAAAMGDVDLDGRNELVVVDRQLFVMDVGTAPLSAASTWPMDGHDPQRTGCSDCPEDVTTAVGDPAATGGTRVRFAGAFPNPTSGPSTQFRFAVPLRAQASLEIYDLAGRRVRRVLQEEIAAGEHVLGWNGRDDAGRPLAGGQYFARLRVRGPGVREDVSRRITVLR